MNTGTLVASIWALALFVLMLIYEIRWRMQIKRGSMIEGEVIGIHSPNDDDGSYAIIEYFLNGVRHEFYGTSVLDLDPVGAIVSVLHDPINNKAYQLTFRHRWFITCLLSGLTFLFVCLAVASK